MVSCVSMPSVAIRATVVLASIAALGGCGSSRHGSSTGELGDPGALRLSSLSASNGCAATVIDTLGKIAERVYNEGVSSERTASARALIAASLPLREAVEAGDAPAARAAARSLLATGHMTDLKVMRGGRVLVNVGAPHALAPLSGTITGAALTPIGTYVASVWADSGFFAEARGIAEGSVALRTGAHSIAASLALPRGELPAEGSITAGHLSYRYTSFAASVYPTGQAVRMYLLRSLTSTAPLCGHTQQDTLVNTLSRVANNIYDGERDGRATLEQVHRVQHDSALLRAVAAREPAAATEAITTLLNQHIVRLRVSIEGRLLSDVGGPYVLAPVTAPLRLGGRTIGSFVLSIQDDEGYRRLTKRLAGLDVLMYMGSTLVKNDLGPNPGTVPASGTYHYGGRTFRVYTLHAEAFPSGPLKIDVLIPIPYT
jgi:hypothetical protein